MLPAVHFADLYPEAAAGYAAGIRQWHFRADLSAVYVGGLADLAGAFAVDGDRWLRVVLVIAGDYRLEKPVCAGDVRDDGAEPGL
ncbi:hypothetical protein D3C76_1558960 [compost metagenome]